MDESHQTAQVTERKGRARRAWDWVLGEIEPLLAIVAAAVVTVLEISHNTSDEVTRAAILGVLLLLAISIIRDRTARAKADERIQANTRALGRVEEAVESQGKGLADGLRDLDGAIAALDSPFPYEVMSQRLVWDLDEKGGARVSKHATVRFIRDRTRVVEQRYWGSGKVKSLHHYMVTGGTKRELNFWQVKSGNELIRLVDLGQEISRGEMHTLLHERVVEKQFPDDDEDIEIKVDTTSYQATVEVLWPATRTPGLIRLKGPRPGDPAEPIDDLLGDADGDKKRISKTFYNLKIGDRLTISWKW